MGLVPLAVPVGGPILLPAVVKASYYSMAMWPFSGARIPLLCSKTFRGEALQGLAKSQS